MLGRLSHLGLVPLLLLTPYVVVAGDPVPRPDGRLECFEVAHPVRGPAGPVSSSVGSLHPADGGTPTSPSCSVLLMAHDFAFSYGKPFVGRYDPPGCAFDRVVLNLTVSSQGRQFDRLAMMFLGDTEVWRTSTAEPSPSPGIVWSHLVDATPYLSLWRAPQTVIFDLGNLVNEKYTGVFSAYLTATFFSNATTTTDDGDDVNGRPRQRRHRNQERPADLIIPLGPRRGSLGQPSHWVYPAPVPASLVVSSFPPNARRAVLTVSANGQIGEEFWWANQLQSDAGLFPPETLPGLSPFREVQALVDGVLAGVQWPFPIVFTGGYAPAMHRPVVGIGAFDLGEGEIDISAWLPVLCDGNAHEVELRVVGVDDDGKGGASLVPVREQYWVLTGKIFVWLGEDGAATTGGPPTVTTPEPKITYASRLEKRKDKEQGSLVYSIEVTRDIAVTARIGTTLATGGGSEEAGWSQKLSFRASGEVHPYGGYSQAASVDITGQDDASGPARYEHRYSFPTSLAYAVIRGAEANTTRAALNQTRNTYVGGSSVFVPGTDAFASADKRFRAAAVANSRNSTGTYVVSAAAGSGRSSSSSDTVQEYQLTGYPAAAAVGNGIIPRGPETLYSRTVHAQNDRMTRDHEVVANAAAGDGRRVFELPPSSPAVSSSFSPLDARPPLDGGRVLGGGGMFAGGSVFAGDRVRGPKPAGPELIVQRPAPDVW